MNETQKRIQAYKAALPGLKERVLAVALLLVMSAAMLTSASFAWITLSRAPEVKSVLTTVTANGNLEIALASPGGEVPGESAVGDSSAALGQSVVKANMTWGNLVNLSDESYGLNHIVLRPALLGDTNDLLSQPLKGVDYGEDGRVELYYNEDYQFTNWFVPDDGNGYFLFNETPQYGVRAISTIKYEYKNNAYYGFTQLLAQANGMHQTVERVYDDITRNDEYINSLAAMIGNYMTDNLNDSDTDVTLQVKALFNMMEEVYGLMVGAEGQTYCFEDVLTALANMQVYLKYGPDDYVTHTYTRETFMAATTAELKANGVVIDCLDDYLTVRSNFYTVIYGDPEVADDSIYDFYRRIYPYTIEGTDEVDEERRDTEKTVLLSELIPYVNKMVKIDDCTITISTGETYRVGSIGKKVAMNLIFDGKLDDGVDAKITKGYLVDFEKVTGFNMVAGPVNVSATYMMTIDITANTITTTAPLVSLYEADVATTEKKAAENKGEYTGLAQDTYGMALDFWVRTNSANNYLVLQGNVLSKTEQVRDTDVDKNGLPCNLYTVTVSREATDENGEPITVTEDRAVYMLKEKDEAGVEKEVWYYARTHISVYDAEGNPPEGQTISNPIERFKDVTTVLGYEGENRIWQENALLNVDSTTQGNGSCYVFYAEDPAQQENSLRLLSNLRVAFVDSNTDSPTYGKMVATAKLDIDSRYEESGRVTVPLVLNNDGSDYLTKTENGLAIMRLERNKATRLTAVIYLDGREISNAEVLAANDIQGQLNIQFGGTETMEAIRDEALELATRSISAVIKKPSDADYPASNNNLDNDGDGKTDPDISFSFDEASETNPMTVDVKVTVTGDNPAKMTAFFMRKVNETQGSRETSFKLNQSTTEEGVWTGQFTFTAPGEYVLRTVQLDGVDYDLPTNNYPKVSISGFGIREVAMYQGGAEITEMLTTIMTGERIVETDLSLSFASGQARLPSSVQLQFSGDDGTQVNTIMTYDATTTTWYGTARFTSSGVYTLHYVIMDGEYTELDPRYRKELDISMGMTVRVIDGGDFRNTLYLGQSITVPMYVEIYDDNDDEIKFLQGVKLYYTRNGSPVEGMNPDMKWSATDDCYIGNIQIPGPARYTFNSVVVGANTLSSTVNTPPVFVCASPNPPEYVAGMKVFDSTEEIEDADQDHYLLSTTARNYQITAQFKEASAAAAYAVMYNADSSGSQHIVEATSSTNDVTGITTFTFVVPKQAGTGYQSGDWTIQEIWLSDVYDEDGTYYVVDLENRTDEQKHNPMRFTADMLAQEGDHPHMKIVNVLLNVEGKSNENLTGTFMESKTITDPVTITITDHNKETLLFDISDISLTYKLRNDYSNYGGYTADHLGDQTGVGENDTYTITSTDNKTFKLNSLTLVYAGAYEPTNMSFTVDDPLTEEDYKWSSDRVDDLKRMGVPSYLLTTTTPTLAIDHISPSGSHPTINSSKNQTTVTSKIEGNTITIYPHATKNGCNSALVEEPKVYLKVQNLGKDTSVTATLTFTESAGGEVHLYYGASSKNGTRTNAFTWTAGSDEIVMRFVGYNDAGSCDDSKAAGTLTSANVLELKKGDYTYKVSVSVITIKNTRP